MIPTASPVGLVPPPSPMSAVSLRMASERVVLGVAIAGLSSLGLALTPWMPPAAEANELCRAGDNSTVALCCNGQAVQGVIPHLSTSFAQDVCQILAMPTASRSEGENFLSQIEPNSLLTNTSPSAEAMTLPSLWWTRDSIPGPLGRHRLVNSWVSYTIQGSDVRVVDVMIDSQFWRALTMPQRYGVLSQFGTSAQEFGYHLRFFQSNGYSARMIGLYGCEATTATPLSSETTPRSVSCLISVDTPRLVQWQQAAAMPNPDRAQATSSLPGATADRADGSPTVTAASPANAAMPR